MADADTTTIVAISTPPGRGALGLVRLSGPRALEVGRAVFHVEPRLRRDGRVRHGRVLAADGRVVDDALAWCLKGPATYTGEDVVEISTHGSPALLALVVDAACRHGARPAGPGEFTRRAFLHGRLDLVQAEAVADLIGAQSAGGFHVAYGALSGGLSARLREIREALVEGLAGLEAGLDFTEDVSEEELRTVTDRVCGAGRSAAGLQDTFAGARRRLEGYRVAIAGRPNAGKSTLLNRFLGEERALVSATPGTTRDWIEAQVMWEGEIVRLVDTAGLRAATDDLEAAGIAAAQRQVAAADVVLYVIDGSDPHGHDPEVDRVPPGALIVLNKVDRGRRATVPEAADAIAVSATRGDGLETVKHRVLERLPRDSDAESIGVIRERHVEGLRRVEDGARDAEARIREGAWELAAADLHRSLEAVAELLGEGVGDAVLDRIFSTFCIGK